MNGTKEQVLQFLEKCDELKNCKFIMATSKIKEILKCIVNSPELYKLFGAVTDGFNYPEQKFKCLVTVDDGIMKKSYVKLPQTVGQRLAFIFCLFVEIDHDTLKLNDFLQVYFREDGSYFASYQAFCSQIVCSLQDMICRAFEDLLNTPEDSVSYGAANSSRSSLLTEINLATESEKRFLANSFLSQEDKSNGIKILEVLFDSVKEGDVKKIDALICGYNYFVLYNRCVSDNVASLIESLGEYEATL